MLLSYFSIAGREHSPGYAVNLRRPDKTVRYSTGQSIASLNARGVAIGMARQVNLDEPLTGEQAGYTIYVDRVSQ